MDVVNRSQDLSSISFITGSMAGRTFPISKSVITIGREPKNDIVLSDQTVSREHARLVNTNGQWSIEKLAPTNTITVNKREVQSSPINDRDEISLGGVITFLFHAAPASSSDMHGAIAAPPSYNQPVVPQQSFAQPSFPPRPQSQPLPPQQSFAQAPFPPQSPPYASSPSYQSVGAQVPGAGMQPSLNAPYYTEPVPPGAAAGKASIEVVSNVHSNKLALPLTKDVINIGRDPSNDVVITEQVVSGFHAQIVREGNQYVFIHPHPQARQGRTLNGIIYQGRHIKGDEAFRKPLARGDFFRIGDEHGTLVTISYNDGSGASQDFVPEIRPIPLGAPVITIGRMTDNMVVLNHPQVSGRHARLEQAQGGYRLVDTGSTNHVYVNGQRTNNQMLKPGDEIRIGPFNLTYTGTQLTQRDESGGIRIDALSLIKEGNKRTVLINDISLTIPPRKFVALVGGSGAGKSTLMDALNGLRPAQKGAVFYNGKDYYHHLAAFSTQLGYVPQDDIIHRDLTVERALYYTARMRLPEDFTEEQVRQRIDEVLDDVEMKHRRKLLVSKLSGGQRKRVSIALELLANPSVFFLDEPTSGLDPGLDRKMMFLLRKLADKGHTIILVTHATNNINACDYICFLAQGGRLVFFGPPNEAKTYFGKTDFAEIYSALEPTDENPNIPAEAEARFKASPLFQQFVVSPLQSSPATQANRQLQTTEVVQPKRGNPWRQFSLLSRRYIELLKNDSVNLMILLLQAPIIALILFFMLSNKGSGTFNPYNVVGCILNPPGSGINIPVVVQPPNIHDCANVVAFLNSDPRGIAFAAQKGGVNQALPTFFKPLSGNDAQKYLFIMAFAATMFGCINGAREIVKEAPIYRRERTVNLGIAPYMFSKIAVLGLLCLIQSAVLVLVVNAIAPIQQGIILPAALEVYITMALTSLAGLMIGLTLSALAPNNDRAVSFIPIILIPQVIFSGILFQINGPFLQVFSSFFAVRWGMAAAGSSVGIHGDLLGGDSWSYQGTLFSTHTQAEASLHLLLCWSALLIMIVGLGILTAFFLKRKDVRA
ncbi:MAG TPA: FHA domain-containing protein [Ktedonobacteraceae bacterium]|nr:FHA domain-containing protein [Ktedonobacteraceae bacterium]